MNVIHLKSPLLVIVSGSSFKENVCVLNNEILLPRDNCEDKIIIIDIDSEVLIRHKKYIKGKLPGVNISLKLGDMNKLPFKKDSVDLLINDCAINFNRFSYQNNKTISEIARVLKHNSGICFFSCCVNKEFDNPRYGDNQEMISDKEINKLSYYYSFKTLQNGKIKILYDQKRKAWPVNYYKNLFFKNALSFIEFDIVNGKNFFPAESQISYRRFLLQKR